MTADVLRRAATMIRERVRLIDASEPWFKPEWFHAGVVSLTDAAYIALMSPPVAFALADLLDAEATRFERGLSDGSTTFAIAVAHAVLGEQPMTTAVVDVIE